MTDALSELRELVKCEARKFQDRLTDNPCITGNKQLWWASIGFADQLAEALLPSLEKQLKESNAASWGLGVIHEHNRLEQREREFDKILHDASDAPIPEGICTNDDQREGYSDGVCCTLNFIWGRLSKLRAALNSTEGSRD